MDDRTRTAYEKLRRENPTMAARHALAQAKTQTRDYGWEESNVGDYRWTKTVGRFEVVLKVIAESSRPMPDKQGDTDYGAYIEPAMYWQDYTRHPNGLPFPAVDTPLALPVEHFRYETGDSHQPYGFFYPDGIEEHFQYAREQGMAKQPAREDTTAWIEKMISDLMGDAYNAYGALTYYNIVVEVRLDGVELAGESMGFDTWGPTPEVEHEFFLMVDEYGMVDDALDAAREKLDELGQTPDDRPLIEQFDEAAGVLSRLLTRIQEERAPVYVCEEFEIALDHFDNAHNSVKTPNEETT